MCLHRASGWRRASGKILMNRQWFFVQRRTTVCVRARIWDILAVWHQSVSPVFELNFKKTYFWKCSVGLFASGFVCVCGGETYMSSQPHARHEKAVEGFSVRTYILIFKHVWRVCDGIWTAGCRKCRLSTIASPSIECYAENELCLFDHHHFFSALSCSCSVMFSHGHL